MDVVCAYPGIIVFFIYAIVLIYHTSVKRVVCRDVRQLSTATGLVSTAAVERCVLIDGVDGTGTQSFGEGT